MPRALTTKSGRSISDADINEVAARVEEGLDLEAWKPRRGRPSLGPIAGGRSPRIAVRLPEELRRRASERAAGEGRSVSDVVRSLLETYAEGPKQQS